MNKQKIIQACKDANACEEGFERLISAKTDEKFVEVLQDNILWVTENLTYEVIKDVPFVWSKFNGYSWSFLLKNQPQLHIHCEWSKFNGYNWSNLLRQQPQFDTYCEWDKLEGYGWSNLLIKQPQFHIHCEWNKLEDCNWGYLLRRQPQFKKYMPKN